MATTKHKVLFVVLILLASAIATSYDFGLIQYYPHSDVFWFGVMTGFLACPFIVILVLIGYLIYKLTAK